MATPDDIERRLSTVERHVAQLREQQGLSATDASAARVLAAGADQDVSEVRAELRAHTSALNALREVQVDQGRRLERLELKVDEGFRRFDEGFARVDDSFARVDDSFARVDDSFARVDDSFARVDEGFARVGDVLATVQAGMTQVVGLLEGLEDRDR